MNPHFQIFKYVTNLVVDHNTLIPSYIVDTPLLIHLAFILFPQLGDNALEKIVWTIWRMRMQKRTLR
jgi:hypothetical protein